MRKISVKTKNDDVVLLCEGCQLEIEENETICQNCGLEYASANSDDWTLEPVNVTAQQLSSDSAIGSFDNPNTSKPKKKMRISKGKTLSILTLLFAFSCYIFSSELLNVVSSPFLKKAAEESEALQTALLKFRDHNSQWPETISKLQYFQHITDNRISDFVLTSNGSYNQILNSPFYLEGKVINWRKSGKVWRCYSKELIQLNLKMPCEG